MLAPAFVSFTSVMNFSMISSGSRSWRSTSLADFRWQRHIERNNMQILACKRVQQKITRLPVMPTLSDSEVARPKSWIEFEDICLSACELRWGDRRTLTPHGRPGQKQNGVDIYGKDDRDRDVAIQCKNTARKLSPKVIDSEVRKSAASNPGTSSSRNSRLSVKPARERPGPKSSRTAVARSRIWSIVSGGESLLRLMSSMRRLSQQLSVGCNTGLPPVRQLYVHSGEVSSPPSTAPSLGLVLFERGNEPIKLALRLLKRVPNVRHRPNQLETPLHALPAPSSLFEDLLGQQYRKNLIKER